MTPLTDIVLAVYFRLFAAGIVLWLAGAAMGSVWLVLIGVTCMVGGTLVMMPVLWVVPTVDAVREYRAYNRRIDQRVREAMAADCD